MLRALQIPRKLLRGIVKIFTTLCCLHLTQRSCVFCLHNANATQLQFNSVQKSFLVLRILLPGRFLNPGLKEVVFFKTQLVAEQINIIINFPHDREAQKNLGATLPFLSLTILSPSSSFLYEGLQNFQPL